MKKKMLCVCLLAMLILSTVTVVACKKTPPPEQFTVTVSAKTLQLDRYGNSTLTAVVKGEDGATVDKTVTWTSSDESVAAVNGGVVQATGDGTATITASAENGSDTCAVTVEDTGLLPSLVLTENAVELLDSGSSLTVGAKVRYLLADMTDAAFTYKVEDTAVATVSNSGVVTPVAYGNTTLTVAAQWRGAAAALLTKTIPVTVQEDVSVNITGTDSTIYTTAQTVNSVSYPNLVTFIGSVEVAVGTVVEANKSWKSSNTAVATVAGGVVTAVSEGTTVITLEYTTANETHVSAPITVTVEFLIADLSAAKSIDIDLSAGGYTPNITDIFGAAQTVTKVTAGSGSTDIYSGGQITVSGLTAGESSLTLYTADYAIKVGAVFITKIITTENQLRTLQALGGVVVTSGLNIGRYTEKTTYVYDGYFILGNNITAASSTPLAASSVDLDDYDLDEYNQSFGFRGTFDGRGYIISGFTIGGFGGLFGALDGAVVKNFGIVNATLTDVGGPAGALAHAARNSTVENVFVEAKTTAGQNNYKAGLVLVSLSGMVYKNNVVVADFDTGTRAGILFDMLIRPLTAASVNNYAVSVGANEKVFDSGAGEAPTTAQAKLVKFAEAQASDFTGLSSDFWLTGGKIPVPQTLTLDCDENVTMYSEQSYTAADYVRGTRYYTVDVGTLPSDVSYANGAFTLAAGANTNFTFTVTSTLNANLSVVVNVTVVEVVYIPGQLDLILDVDTELELTLPTGHGFNALTAVIKVNEVELNTYTYATDTITILAGQFTFGAKVITVRTDNMFIAYNNVAIISKVITTESELRALQALGNVVVTSGLTIDRYTEKTTYVYDGYFILGNNITASSSTAITSNTVNCDDYDLDRYGSDFGFKGTFDGRGYILSNFTIGFGGLFGSLDGATVKNLGVVNATLTHEGGGPNAAIAHAARNSTIENVFVEVNIAAGNYNMKAGLVRMTLSGMTCKNNVVVADFGTAGDSEQMGILFSLMLFPLTADSVNNYAVSAGAVEAISDMISITGPAQAKLVKFAEAQASDFTGLSSDFWLTGGKIPVPQTLTLDCDENVTMYSEQAYAVADYVRGTRYYTVDVGALPSDVSYANGAFTLAAGANTNFTFTVTSTLNANLSVVVNVTVVEVVYIPGQLDLILDVDTELELTLPTGHGFNASTDVIKVNEVELNTYTYATDTITILAGQFTFGAKVITVRTDNMFIAYNNVAIISKVITTESELRTLQTLGNVVVTSGLTIDRYTDKTTYVYDGYFILGNNITAANSTAITSNTVNCDDYDLDRYGSDFGFKGTFDGRGYILSNFTIGFGGLFGSLDGATVKNLGVVNATLTHEGGGPNAAIAHAARNSTIENVFVEVNIAAGNYNMKAGLVRMTLSGMTCKNNVVVADFGTAGDSEQMGILFSLMLFPLTADSVNNYAVSAGAVEAISDMISITGPAQAKLVKFAEAQASDFTGLSPDFWLTGGKIPVPQTLTLDCDENVTMNAGSSYTAADYVRGTRYYTVDAGTLPSDVSYANGVFTLAAGANTNFTFTIVSTLNANLTKVVSVTVA